MPTVLRIKRFRFHFYSADGNEPPHIHVRAGKANAKFWLTSVKLARSSGFKAHELRKIETLITNHQQALLEAWHEYFTA
jgi:hypothetical protein